MQAICTDAVEGCCELLLYYGARLDERREGRAQMDGCLMRIGVMLDKVGVSVRHRTMIQVCAHDLFRSLHAATT